MKKIKIFLVIAFLSILIIPANGRALTADELQVQIDALLARISELQGQLAKLQSSSNLVSGCGIVSFERNLKIGTPGTDIKCLQIILNSNTATRLADSGIGSSGNETEYFGYLTKTAVIKFQELYASEILFPLGLSAGTGFVGSLTRKKLNEFLIPEIQKPEPEPALELEPESESESIASGSLIISKDDSSPGPNIVVGKETADLIIFDFYADETEDLDIDKITATLVNGSYIETLYFYDGENLLGSIPGADEAIIRFDDNTLIIPADSHKLITVKAKFLAVDENIINSDSQIKIQLSKNNAIQATGLSSGQSIGSGSQTVQREIVYIFKSRPYFSVNPDSPSGNMLLGPNILLAVLDVKAGSEGDIVFDRSNENSIKVMIDYKITDVSESGPTMTFYLRDSKGRLLDSRQITKIKGIQSDSIIFAFSLNSFTVPAGQTEQLYIYGDTSDFEESGDSIQLWLSGDDDDNISWGINDSGSYSRAEIIFKNNIYVNKYVRY